MTSLDSIQRTLSEAVRSSSSRFDEGTSDVLDSLVAPSPRGMTSVQRVDVYREQFWLRHLTNLEEDYPTLRWAVGAGAFRELAVRYLRVFPPGTWNLERLGQDLPSFLARDCSDYPRLAHDAAHLDWAFMTAFGAPDAPTVNDKALGSIPEDAWPGTRVHFLPSLTALALSHPVQEVREAIQRGEAPESPAPSNMCVVVWRDPACYLRVAPIEPLAHELLGALRDGAALGEACERIAASIAGEMDVAALGSRVAAWFQQWTANAWIAAVRLPYA